MKKGKLYIKSGLIDLPNFGGAPPTPLRYPLSCYHYDYWETWLKHHISKNWRHMPKTVLGHCGLWSFMYKKYTLKKVRS